MKSGWSSTTMNSIISFPRQLCFFPSGFVFFLLLTAIFLPPHVSCGSSHSFAWCLCKWLMETVALKLPTQYPHLWKSPSCRWCGDALSYDSKSQARTCMLSLDILRYTVKFEFNKFKTVCSVCVVSHNAKDVTVFKETLKTLSWNGAFLSELFCFPNAPQCCQHSTSVPYFWIPLHKPISTTVTSVPCTPSDWLIEIDTFNFAPQPASFQWWMAVDECNWTLEKKGRKQRRRHQLT